MTPQGTKSFVDKTTETVDTLGATISDAATQVKDKANDLGRTAAKKLEDSRHAAVRGLDSTASALHQGGEKVTGMAHGAADALTSTADYLRNHDAKSMLADIGKAVKNNPGPALLAAGVLGFLMGRALRSSD